MICYCSNLFFSIYTFRAKLENWETSNLCLLDTFYTYNLSNSIVACCLKPTRECQTGNLRLEGATNWTPTMYIRLVQDFGLEFEVAQHLANSYGDRAFAVAKLASVTGNTCRKCATCETKVVFEQANGGR